MAEELEAGRALDAMIAERVFGWRYALSKHGHWRVYPPTDAPTEEPMYGAPKFDANTGQPITYAWHDGVDLPAYSTDVSAAWGVVERLNAADWLVVVKSMPADVPFSLDLDTDVRSIHRRAVVQLTDMRYAKGAGLLHARHIPPTFGDTAPLAICRAALAAVASTTTEEKTA